MLQSLTHPLEERRINPGLRRAHNASNSTHVELVTSQGAKNPSVDELLVPEF
jgi:hypothetical protein